LNDAAAVTGVLVGYRTKTSKNEASGIFITIELDDFTAKQFHRAFPETHVAVAVVRMLEGGEIGTVEETNEG
jgi:hypothetical protein